MKTLLLIVLFALPVSLFAQTNTAGYDQLMRRQRLLDFLALQKTNTANYDQLMNQAGSQIASGNLDAAKQTAQQVLQLDGQNWRGNALMAAILQKQNDFTNAQIYIQKAIATAPADKQDKLNAMAQTITASAAQGASAVSGGMSPEARIKYDGLMVIAGEADKATIEDDRKQALRKFMAKSAAFLELVPDATNVWVMRALTAMELDYPCDGFYAGRKLKEFGLENSDDPKVQKAFGELDAKDWLGENIKGRDWSKWTTDQARAAANEGDEEAQNALGYWYKNGESGFSKDYAQAADWYRKAAAQGNAQAESCLGVMYESGRGVEKNNAVAKDWYQKAAAQGDQNAKNFLADLNQLDALRQKAEQGDATAQLQLGMMYRTGFGVTQDYAQALDWFRKSAAQGNEVSQFWLGMMYQNGWGLEKNIARAKDWYQKAAAQGAQYAKDALAKLNQSGQ